MSLKYFLPLVLFLAKPAHSFEFDEIKQVVFQIPNTGSADIPSYDTPTRTCVNSDAPPTSGATFATVTAVSNPTGITINVDPATPSLNFKRTSKQGLAYELIWSEEFVMDGREFGFDDGHSDCDDAKWERARPDSVPHWELFDLTEDEFDTFQGLDSNYSSNGLNYVYIYGDNGIDEAAGRAKCCPTEEDDNEEDAPTFSIAPPPSDLMPSPNEEDPPVIMLMRPYAEGWSAFAHLNNRGGRELIQTREPICVPLGGFIEVGVIMTGLPNVQHLLRRVVFWPGQPLTSLDKYSWKLLNDSVMGWDFDSDIILDPETGKVHSLETFDEESTGFIPYRFTDMQVRLGLPTETGDVDYVRVYAPAYTKSHGGRPVAACDESATGRPVAENYFVIDLAHVRGL